MKKWMLIVFVCGMLAGYASLAPADEKSGNRAGESGPTETGISEKRRIIARVNGVEISEGSLSDTEALIRAENMKAGRNIEDKAVRKEALERLILQELIYQRARETGMKADEKEIALYIDKMKANAGSDEAFRKYLLRENLSEKDLRAVTERNVLIRKLYDQEVSARAVVSDEEMRAEYEREKSRFVIPEKIVLDDLIFFLDPEDSSSVKKAEEMLRVLRDEKKDLSTLESDGTFVVRELTNPQGRDFPLLEAAGKLREGELSGLIKAGGNIHIIRLKKHSLEKQFVFDDVKRMIENKLRTDAQNKLKEKWRSDLKKNARIEILLKDTGEE